jgi:hypothetical protein
MFQLIPRLVAALIFSTKGNLPMSDIFPPMKQRPALLELAEALDSRPAQLRRDECGDWAIFGRRTHLRRASRCFGAGVTLHQGFQLVIGTDIEHEGRNSARQWSADKKRLNFCQVTQDGDEEGCLILDRLPTKAEGAIIRDVVAGIPKARHLSEEHPLRAHSFRVQGGFQPDLKPKTPSQACRG